jgi:hypothetical protein
MCIYFRYILLSKLHIFFMFREQTFSFIFTLLTHLHVLLFSRCSYPSVPLPFQLMPLYMDTIHLPQWSECQVICIDLLTPCHLAFGIWLPQPAWVWKDTGGRKWGWESKTEALPFTIPMSHWVSVLASSTPRHWSWPIAQCSGSRGGTGSRGMAGGNTWSPGGQTNEQGGWTLSCEVCSFSSTFSWLCNTEYVIVVPPLPGLLWNSLLDSCLCTVLSPCCDFRSPAILVAVEGSFQWSHEVLGSILLASFWRGNTVTQYTCVVEMKRYENVISQL